MSAKTIDTATIGVVGAGAMGSGIAQVAAAAGMKVKIFDQREGAAGDARQRILKRMEKRVSDGKANPEALEVLREGLHPAESLEEFADCGLVVEAIVENLEAKRSLFGQLVNIVAADAVLASNTSSLPIGAIARGMDGTERFAGLHFFNPVPVMKLVEVIRGPDTAGRVIDGLLEFSRKVGR